MVINRLSGLVLPASTKFLVDDVIGKRHLSLLYPLVGVVLAATIIQGLTSYALTQTLSKAAQKLIAEMRRQVQEHVGRLSVTYYDSNKTGTLVSRIMSDVEGVRNLVGTGLVDFVGGTADGADRFRGAGPNQPADDRRSRLASCWCSDLALRKAFRKIRPIFRERGKINAEVTGRLTESLGGVRVVKGYHAEEREHEVFSGGVERLLRTSSRSLTATSVMGLSATTLMGIVGAIVMFMGTRADPRRHTDAGRLLHLHHVPGISWSRRCSRWSASARRSPKRSRAWSARARCWTRDRRDEDPRRTVTLGRYRRRRRVSRT